MHCSSSTRRFAQHPGVPSSTELRRASSMHSRAENTLRRKGSGKQEGGSNARGKAVVVRDELRDGCCLFFFEGEPITLPPNSSAGQVRFPAGVPGMATLSRRRPCDTPACGGGASPCHGHRRTWGLDALFVLQTASGRVLTTCEREGLRPAEALSCLFTRLAQLSPSRLWSMFILELVKGGTARDGNLHLIDRGGLGR